MFISLHKNIIDTRNTILGCFYIIGLKYGLIFYSKIVVIVVNCAGQSNTNGVACSVKVSFCFMSMLVHT